MIFETTLYPSESEAQTVQKVFLNFLAQMHQWVTQTRKRNSLYLRDRISIEEFRTQSEQQLLEIFGEFVLTTQQAEITYRYCMVRIGERYKLLDSRHYSTSGQPFQETHL